MVTLVNNFSLAVSPVDNRYFRALFVSASTGKAGLESNEVVSYQN